RSAGRSAAYLGNHLSRCCQLISLGRAPAGRAIRFNLLRARKRISAPIPHAGDETMRKHTELSKAELRRGLRNKELVLAGNSRLKIYGTVDSKSGKRMKRENRVFFSSEAEAL